MSSIFTSGILTAGQAMKTSGSNIAAVNVKGYKRSDLDFRTLGGNSGSVEVRPVSTIDVTGGSENTNRLGDFSIANIDNGRQGFLVVAPNENSNEKLLTTTGSFALDKEGVLKEETTGRVLLAAAVREDGSADLSQLGPIKIDLNTVFPASATTKIDAKMLLDSTKLVKGDGQTILAHAAAPDDLIDAKGIKAGSKIKVSSKQTDNRGVESSSATEYTFGGFLFTKFFDKADTTLSTVTGDINITIGGKLIPITGVAGATDEAYLTAMATEINKNLNLQAKVIEDTAGKIGLMIAPKDIKEGISVDPADAPVRPLSFDSNKVLPSAGGENRFATMQQLYEALKKNSGAFSKVEISKAAGAVNTSIVLKTVSTSSVSITNLQQKADLLTALGVIPEQSGTIQPVYAPLITGESSMASGDVTPDEKSEVSVYDAQGNKRQVYIAVKKVGDNLWGVEVYYPQDNDTDNKGNILAQAGLVSFDEAGRFKSVGAISIPFISSLIGDLNQDLAVANGDSLDITVDGVTKSFVYDSTTPGGIKTGYDLITQVSSSKLPLKVNIVPDGAGSKLKFICTVPGGKMTITGPLATKLGIDPASTTSIPVFGEGEAEFNWTTNPSAVEPGRIKINLKDELATQQNQQFDLKLNVLDGEPTGSMLDWSADKNGMIALRFSNGATKNAYQLPVATVPDAHGLIDQGNNAYTTSIKSGNAQYNLPGTGSVPFIEPKTRESSNIEQVKEMTSVIEVSQWNSILTAGYQVENQMMRDVIGAMRS